jgi:hypothetical protein
MQCANIVCSGCSTGALYQFPQVGTAAPQGSWSFLRGANGLIIMHINCYEKVTNVLLIENLFVDIIKIHQQLFFKSACHILSYFCRLESLTLHARSSRLKEFGNFQRNVSSKEFVFLCFEECK